MGRMIIGYIDLLMMIDDNTVKHRLFSLFHLIVSKEILNEKPKEKEYSLRWWCLAYSGDSRLPSVLTQYSVAKKTRIFKDIFKFLK